MYNLHEFFSKQITRYIHVSPDLQDDDIPLPDFDDRGPNPLTDITVVEQDIIDVISLHDPNKAVGKSGNGMSSSCRSVMEQK
jgi:hypothetical protein